MAKQSGFASSLLGMLIGLLLVVIVSPYLIWQSQSQHRAKDFETATPVASDSNEEGYLIVEGDPSLSEPIVCPRIGDNLPAREEAMEDEEDEYVDEEDVVDPVEAALEDAGYEFEDAEEPASEETDEPEAERAEPTDCLYVRTQVEAYSRAEKEVCGDTNEDQTVIKRLEDRCDDDGCEPCYLVEEFDWTETSSDSQYASFAIGSYSIDPSGSANVIGAEELTDYEFPRRKNVPEEGDRRVNFRYMESGQKILVAGDASGQEIDGALDDKPFVISSKSRTGTLEALQSQDASSKWMLLIGSLLAMVIGMLLVVGPLTSLTNVFKAIPVVGKHADKGLDAVIGFIAVAVGLVIWGVVYAFVLIAKNILIVLAVLAAIGAIAFLVASRGKKGSS